MKRFALLVVVSTTAAACSGGPDLPPGMVPLQQRSTPEAGAPPPAREGQPLAQQPVQEQPARRKRKASWQEELKYLAAVNESARQTIFDGYFVEAELNYVWRNGQSYSVRLAVDQPTFVRLFPGEMYKDASFGDIDAFGLDVTWTGTMDTRSEAAGPATTAVPITAFVPNRCQRIAIITSWRVIPLDVCSGSRKAAYNMSVNWVLPEKEREAMRALMADGGVPSPVTGSVVADLDGRFEFEGPPEFRPQAWRATMTRTRLILTPPDGLNFMPVPLLPEDGNGTAVATYDVKPRADGPGSYLEITGEQRAPSMVVLQHGEQTMTVRRAGVS